MSLEDRVLRDLHRAAIDAGRRGISVPSVDITRVIAGDLNATMVHEAMRRLVKDGRATRARRDLLILPDVTGFASVDIVDLISVVAPAPYLITGGRALQHFELTDQHYFGLTVLVPAETAALSFGGERASFFVTERSNIWGAASEHGPQFALPERAIIDALSHPRFGVSMPQIADAIIRAHAADTNFINRLVDAVRAYGAGSRQHGARAAARRVGFIIAQLFGDAVAEPFHPLIGPNRAPVLLRPSRNRGGLINTHWRVIVNTSVETEVAP